MQIEIFTICDNAQSYQGKTVIVGTFNKISSSNFPTRYPNLSIVGRIAYEESGMHKYTLKFISPSGENVVEPLEWTMDVKADHEVGYANFIMGMNDITFNEPGVYKIELHTQEEIRVFKLTLIKNSNN